MRISVLDQSPISEGMTGADALRNSVELARFTEDNGYHRYWVAEHHGTPKVANQFALSRLRERVARSAG